jgi:TP901 family phage tail tape measure protein
MADVNANIGVSIDTSAALAQLKALQRQISQFHSSIARSSESAALAQRSLQKNLIGSINSIGAFSAELRTVKTSAESFTNSLEKNKFSMREYFRYAGASTKTFGRLFKSEFDTIGKVAQERVKTLQTQYIKMGRNASGAMEAIAIRPTSLNMQDYGTRTAIAAQKQALFNQLMKQGTTNLLNFGKNTQWAGRQLMVGFTIPLTIVGSTATKTFMDMEAQALKFRKVYGDLFTPKAETQEALNNITELGRQFTKYGISVSQTVGLAAEAAAAGFQGLDLQRQTTEATRLSVLGQIDSQKALETTISLQNAFGMSSDKLADSINFLNAVENQTVVSLDDITTAIPKVAPVIQQLGGDVKDLTFFIAAMKEGGINASEGANALKSGLAALINPTKKASEMLAGFGINATAIVEKNKGDLKSTVVEFATALNNLDPLARARAIEQMFGKFQFARLSTLFANVAKDGNQAARVLDLANSSVEELSALSEQELGMTADSAMNKFKKSVEDLKFALIPVGQAFLEAATPIIEFVSGVLEKFGNLSDGTKKLITFLTVGIGAIGPIFLMTFGLVANAIANGLKGVMLLRQGYLRLTGQSQILGEQTQYLNTEQLEAAAAAHSLDQSHAKLTQSFTAETAALQQLIAAYQGAARAGQSFMFNNPGMMMPPRGAVRKLANGIVSVPGPKGAGDIVPAMLSPGESVIPADMTKKYAGLIQGMVAGNIPGYMSGEVSVGGRVSTLDFARQDTALKAQRLISAMLANGAGIENALEVVEETLARMASDTKITIDQFVRELDLVTKSITGKQIPGSVFQDAGRGERRFNAGQTGVGTMEEQVAGSAVLEEELTRARGSSNAAQRAMTEYYQSQGKNAAEFSSVVKQAGDVHRAHVITVRSNVDKMFMEAWNPNAWVAQSSTLNQVSNILQSSMSTRDEYFKNLSEINADETIVASIMEKITNNIALTEQELRVQKQVLERMLSSTGSMAKVAPGFGPQAAGAVAATQFLIDNPAQQPGVGTRSAQQKLAAEQSLAQAKFRGQQSFTPITEAARAVTNQVVLETARAAGTQSPSRKTIPIGEDIARGLEVGMQNRKDNVALIGSQLGKAATGGVQGGARNIPFSSPSQPGQQPSTTFGAVAANTPMSPQINTKIKEQAKILQTSNQRFVGLNSKIMGASFAVSSLAGVTSMANGGLGKFSELLFRITGPLFALSTILQLFGGSNIIGLLKKLKLLATGPVGLVIAGLTGLYAINKLYKDSQEKTRMKIEGLGRAASLSADQLKDIGKIVGREPSKDPLTQENLTPTGGSQRENTERIQIDQFKELFKDAGADSYKDFQNTISQIKSASQQQADLIFSSLAIKFAGDYDDKTIKSILIALRESAERQDLKLDFKALNIGTEQGIENLDVVVKQVTDQFANDFDKFFKLPNLASPEKMKDYGINITELFEQFSGKNLNTAAMSINTILSGIALQFKNGVINAEQYSKAVDTVFKKISDPKFKQGSDMLVNAILKNIGTATALAAVEVEKLSSKLMFLEGIMLGIGSTETQNLITIMEQARLNPNDTALQISAGLQEASYRKSVRDRKKLQEELNKIVASPIDTNVTVETEGQKANRQLSIIQNYFNAKEALIKQERQLEEDALQASIDATQKQIDAEQKLIDTNQRSIDLLNRRIDLEYDRPIQKLQDESTILSNNLDVIRKQEDAINSQYDKQIESLEKISSINQEIAGQEKSRLTIADALTSGDIAAAAAAVQDARAQAAASRIDQQTKALEVSRQQALTGITAGGMTKDQIEARTYAIGQQVFSLEQQRKTLQDQIVVLQDKNYATEESIYKIKNDTLITQQKSLDDYKNETILLIKNQTVLGKTQEQWVIAEGKVSLYNAALDLSNEKLSGMDKLLTSIAKKSAEVEATLTSNKIIASGGSTGGRGGGSGSPRGAMQFQMYGGKIKKMNMGGVVPKYMASGGRMGSDTVPAMLTPGEFVMNKQATKSFGPLLSMLNESKYPSMIGSSYDGKGSSGGIMTSVSDNSSKVYNYNVGITVPQSNANPNDIARAVIGQIKYIDNQRIRGQR